jgi:hypothetical protein
LSQRQDQVPRLPVQKSRQGSPRAQENPKWREGKKGSSESSVQKGQSGSRPGRSSSLTWTPQRQTSPARPVQQRQPARQGGPLQVRVSASERAISPRAPPACVPSPCTTFLTASRLWWQEPERGCWVSLLIGLTAFKTDLLQRPTEAYFWGSQVRLVRVCSDEWKERSICNVKHACAPCSI